MRNMGNDSLQWQPAPPKQRQPSNFVIPAKGKQPLLITKPSVAQSDERGQDGISLIPRQIVCAAENSLSTNITSATPISISAHNSNDFPTPARSPPNNGPQLLTDSSQTRKPSTLDIYARKYVPQWLLLVNESPAVLIGPPTIKHVDIATYRASFTGSDFSDLPYPAQVPPLTARQVTSSNLVVGEYALFWEQRLQNEFAAQAFQNHNYGLFNVQISVFKEESFLYKIRLPGVRESTPRVDLGDTLLIRGLMRVIESHVSNQARQWATTRADLAPGFAGKEYHALVWSIVRRDETVIVKLSQRLPLDRDSRFNVIIPVQVHKCYPAYQAVAQTAAKLTSPWSGSQWLRRMLFPNLGDGTIQKELLSGRFRLSWVDKTLNIEQKRAVEAIIDAKYGQLPFLISGPPGTGKTKTLVELVLQLLRTPRRPPPHILVCAPSDSAADTLLVRLSQWLQPKDMFRLNNWTRLASEVPGDVRPYCKVDEEQLHSLPNFETLMQAKVVVTTCRDANVLLDAGLSNYALSLMAMRMLKAISDPEIKSTDLMHWTALLVDEAAQATEPEILTPLSIVAPLHYESNQLHGSPQLIMAGDEFQLGPRLSASHISDNVHKFDIDGLDRSLFQRLFERELYSTHPLSRSRGLPALTRAMLPIVRPPFANLVRNYRSHGAILTTSSSLFYTDTLVIERPDVSQELLSWPMWSLRHGQTWPVIFHSNIGEDRVESVLEGDGTGAGSLTNPQEVEIAYEYVSQLLSHMFTMSNQYVTRLTAKDIIVMSPFRAQVNLLRSTFRDRGLYEVRIGPLEAFQGLESRAVVLCTTRTRLGRQNSANVAGDEARYVQEDRRRGLGVIDMPKIFNVAMTRAQEAMIVIGNEKALTVTGDRCWVNFLRFCQRNQLSATPLQPINDHGILILRGKLEEALRYADLNINMTFNHNHLQQISDLDSQMQTLYVDEEEEQRIREEENEDDDQHMHQIGLHG